MSRRGVLILSPLYATPGSGAATYYRLLVDYLRAEGHRVVIASEGHHGDPDFRELLPERSGRARRPFLDYWAYFKQNVAYPRLGGIIAAEQPSTVLVHSSFYNLPGTFPAVAKRLRRRFPEVRFVLDMRDQLLPQKQAPHLDIFDAVIACSENVRVHARGLGLGDRLHLIPVVQPAIEEPFGASWVDEPYILYAGLVKEAKRVDLLLEAFAGVRAERPDVTLVIAGLMKSTSPRMAALLEGDGVRYVGNQEPRRIHELMQRAELVVNVSLSEGMPRSCLEALALQRRVLLPGGVPEFEATCPDWVTRAEDPRQLTDELLRCLANLHAPAYPVEMHAPEVVLPAYLPVLGLAARSTEQ